MATGTGRHRRDISPDPYAAIGALRCFSSFLHFTCCQFWRITTVCGAHHCNPVIYLLIYFVGRDEVLVWLSVWSEVQIVCIVVQLMPPLHPQTPLSLASFKSRLVGFTFLVPA